MEVVDDLKSLTLVDIGNRIIEDGDLFLTKIKIVPALQTETTMVF